MTSNIDFRGTTGQGRGASTRPQSLSVRSPTVGTSLRAAALFLVLVTSASCSNEGLNTTKPTDGSLGYGTLYQVDASSSGTPVDPGADALRTSITEPQAGSLSQLLDLPHEEQDFFAAALTSYADRCMSDLGFKYDPESITVEAKPQSELMVEFLRKQWGVVSKADALDHGYLQGTGQEGTSSMQADADKRPTRPAGYEEALYGGVTGTEGCLESAQRLLTEGLTEEEADDAMGTSLWQDVKREVDADR